MYDELVKALRLCREDESCFKDCPYYEKCFSPNGQIIFGVMQDAADAIEKLQAQLMFSNDAAKAIAEKVPKWIPVTERLPEDMHDVLVYAGVLFPYITVGHYDGL